MKAENIHSDFLGLNLLFEQKIYQVSEKHPTPKNENNFLVNEETKKEPDPYPFGGLNKNGLVILSKSDLEQASHQAEKELCGKICAAIGFKLEESALFYLEDFSADTIRKIADSTQGKYLVLFGISPHEIGLNSVPNTVGDVFSLRGVFTYSLKDLNNDKNKKAAFWAGFKELKNPL